MFRNKKKLIWGITLFVISHFFMYRIIDYRLRNNTSKSEDLIFQFNEKYISCTQISEFEIYCLLKDIKEI